MPLTVRAMLAISQDVHLDVPRLLSHCAIPDNVVMAMGFWAVLEALDRNGKPDGFTVSRPSSPACKGSRTYSAKYFACKHRLQVFWHDWVYAGSQSSIAKLAQVARRRPYMLNLTTRCIGLCQEEQTVSNPNPNPNPNPNLGLCQEEQTVLQLQALGVQLSPLGWRNMTIQRLSGSPTPTVDRPIPTAGRLVGGYTSPCSIGRTVLSSTGSTKDAEDDVYASRDSA